MTILTKDIRAVAFDAVGTLIYPDPPAPFLYAQVGRRHGSRLAAGDIGIRFAAAFAAEEAIDRSTGFRTSEGREIERWRRIVGQVLDDVDNGEACFQELFDHFRRPASWRCDREAGATLQELERRGFALAVASNYDYRLRSVAAGLADLRPITSLVISSEVGWRKPAPDFFAALCRTLGLPPAQVLLVGDDLANDYEGGKAAGLQVALLGRPHQTLPPGLTRLSNLRHLVFPEL